MLEHWRPSSSRLWVLRNGRSFQVRNALNAFSIACWDEMPPPLSQRIDRCECMPGTLEIAFQPSLARHV